MLMIIGMGLALSSCQCLTIKNDVRRIWSWKFNQCRCQWYSFENIKALGKPVPCEDFFAQFRDNPDVIKSCRRDSYASENPEYCNVLPNRDYCDDLVGFSKSSWGKNITPRAKESKRCYEDSKDKGSKCGAK